MNAAELIKPHHRAIKNYYERRKEHEAQGVHHEGAVREAFKDLLREAAKLRGWVLLTETSLKVGGKRIQPDGICRDEWQLPHGYWEAKDEHDDLDTEIRKKIAKGYPLSNTIFEDTREAALFQGGQECLRADLRDEKQVARLLNEFLGYQAPDIEEFERAVDQFAERIPDLAAGLNEKIKEAHRDNKAFKEAYEAFFELAKNALNPNLSRDAVDEMLIQHLLTERLIRTIFDNPEFVQKNVIAAEIEKVILALTSQHFNRAEFLGKLDRFYGAIENAARGLEDFTDKQHFLNTVYERFFQGYSVKVADTHGIVYTPQEIVEFMCAAVEEALRDEFGAGLGDEGVNVLDPATGTGSFMVHLLRRTPKDKLEQAYKHQMFANEVMLMPYYIASLNIEHEYYQLTGKYAPFEGLCFVDTLDLAEGERTLSMFTAKNTQRVEREHAANIFVIMGNPPYNVGQINENDNNKNRRYRFTDKRVKETYVRASRATLRRKYYDAYIRFLRWSTDRLGDSDGIVCLVTNNSFIDDVSLDGVRKHLEQDFTRIYHIDLHGNVRKNPALSGTTHNVFGIQVGVGITLAVRKGKRKKPIILYHRVPELWRKGEKLVWLAERTNTGLESINWQKIKSDASATWLAPDNAEEYQEFVAIGSKITRASRGLVPGAIFEAYSLGVSTNRDSVVYDFHELQLATRVERFCEDYNAEIDRYLRKRAVKNLDEFLDYSRIKWSRNLKRSLRNKEYLEYDPDSIRYGLYRPFAKQFLYFADIAVDEPGRFSEFFPTPATEDANKAICVSAIGQRAQWTTLVTNTVTNLNLVSVDAVHCYPLYLYSNHGSNRRDNITDWARDHFRDHYGDNTIQKEDIFYYVYGILHHPGYRTKYADNLKRELPRIPFAPDVTSFRGFSEAGRKLATLHLDYEKMPEFPLEKVFAPNVRLSYRVEKMRLSKDKSALKINESITLRGIPQEAFEYRLGNRSALEWVIDQYQVKEDKRSGIVSDPNNLDDEQYIVRLVGQVVHVSVETVKIVEGLPEDFGG